MSARRPTMPKGVDLDPDRAETQPVNGQRHEPWSESRGGNPAKDESAGAGSASAGDGPAPPPPDAGADPAPAEKRAGVARAGGESWLFARYVAEKIAEYEGRGQEPPQAAQEDAEEPGDPHGGGAAATEARPERSSDEAHEPWDAAMGAAADLAAALRAFKADFVRWAENERRSRRRRAGLAMAVGFPACLLLGLLVEMQFQVIPLHDPTHGWGEHIWSMYGPTIVDCEREAMRTNSEIDCPLVVRP